MLVRAATEQLPQHLPRFLLASLSPQHMLEAVQAGVDVFDSSHAVVVASRGHALSLRKAPRLQAPSKAPVMEAAIKISAPDAGRDDSLDGNAGKAGPAEQSGPELEQAELPPRDSKAETASEVRKDRTQVLPSPAPAYSHPEMNMWAAEFRTDKDPLVLGCQCYACRHHTRAYIHHLLEEHEMSAQVLLEVHNTWQLQCLLDEMRAAIRSGNLQGLRQGFESAA